MNDTLHPSGSISCASAGLQQSLESKLRTLLAKGGSTLCSLSWNKKDTPAGRQYCQLSASALRTFATDCSLWPTPGASEFGGTPEEHLLRKIRCGISPNISSLTMILKMCKDPMLDPQLRISGLGADGYQQLTANSGLPNPAHVSWIMGFPPEWEEHAPTEMPSSPKSPRSSSPHSYNPSARPSEFSGKELWPTCKENPRKEGTWGFKSYSIIMERPGIKYEEFREAGGRLNDLQWDFARGRIELK